MSQDDFLLDISEQIATITLNRPGKGNPMGLHFSQGFNAVLDRIEADPSVRCVIVTGQGRTFCGGGDLNEIMSPEPSDFEAEYKLVRGYNALAKRLYYFDIPVIAAVNGPAVGGGVGIAMACDFALASHTARYDLFFQRLGLSAADVGVPWLLTRIVGASVANYYLLTAGSIDSATGLRLGLFPEVVEPEQLIETARAAAKKIIDASDRSVRISKLALRHGVEMEFSANLEVEAYMQSYAFRTAEHKQRIATYRDRVKKKGT